MEVEVISVGGMESCFVALPLALIHSLQSTCPGFLPPVLALELQSVTDSKEPWHLAWSGAASRSHAIEVAKQLAECIGMPNRTKVQVRAAANLPKATFAMIEPISEDDWEVMELNSEFAEETILKQVGIVLEGMKFPLWLHGHTVATFVVVSTTPKKPVVQLVPETEVAVAPKRRKNVGGAQQGVGYVKEHITTKALLRVQELNRNYVHTYKQEGVKLGVVLTSVVFLHPETARHFMFDNGQLVSISSRASGNGSLQNQKWGASRKKANLTTAEKNNGWLRSGTMVPRHATVCISLSDSVARGHVMLQRSLRLYIKADLHTWVHVWRCSSHVKKDASLILSPCHFKLETDKLLEDNANLFEFRNSLKTNSMHQNIDSIFNEEVMDWSTHEEFIEALPSGCHGHGENEHDCETCAVKQKERLVQIWTMGQLNIMATLNGVDDVKSLVLGRETILHFEVDMGLTFGSCKTGSKGTINMSDKSPLELLFLLTVTSDESDLGEQYESYELAFSTVNSSSEKHGGLELQFEKLDFGGPVCFDCPNEKCFGRSFSSSVSSLSWMAVALTDIINRLTVLLSPSSGKLFSNLDLPLPGHVLVHGPPGSGKTLLAMAVAKHLEGSKDILAHIVFINCSKLALENVNTIRETLNGYISEALDHPPALVIFDDLDALISSSESDGSQSSHSVMSLAEFLGDIMDEYQETMKTSCGIGPVAFMASLQSPGTLPQTLRSSGRFDFHVQMPVFAAPERGALLKRELQKRSLLCSKEVISEIASKCDGYNAYDLEILVDRAVHAAVGRFSSTSAVLGHRKPALTREDFSHAIRDFLPVAMRGVTKSGSEGGRSGWEDIGGLHDIRNSIQEMVELPSKFPDIFANAPLRLRSNVLLYGPPGCGKTHIVGAAAAACSLRFISVKGPELLNKYIGASEQAVRDIFSKAAAAAPCLLFFDEFDSIAPKRGHDNTGVTDRVVNQLLTELDGVEVLTGVFVFAATSRPDLLDAALLRPGRLDHLLFCDFPSREERLDILKVLSRKLPLASDVDLSATASVTDGFSGADLQALLSDAQLESVHQFLDSGSNGQPGTTPVISDSLLKSVASRVRPSISETEKQRLYGIYSQFLDSRKSVAAQTRDAKGKRSTLA
ncbi:hypothetical protein AMTRI_Chr02g213220 [Amborella trichopoda]